MSKIKVQIPMKSLITIKRPNGDLEVVTAPGTKTLNDRLFSRIAEATKRAGRGECISYRNITETKYVDGPTKAEQESDKYHKELKADYRRDAFGEDFGGEELADNTPSTKNDY